MDLRPVLESLIRVQESIGASPRLDELRGEGVASDVKQFTFENREWMIVLRGSRHSFLARPVHHNDAGIGGLDIWTSAPSD
jgi:hypothetical protein